MTSINILVVHENPQLYTPMTDHEPGIQRITCKSKCFYSFKFMGVRLKSSISVC